MVVIRDTSPDGDRYYAVDAGSVQLVLEGADTDLPLSIALGLSNFPLSRTVELGDPDVEPTPATWCCAAGRSSESCAAPAAIAAPKQLRR